MLKQYKNNSNCIEYLRFSNNVTTVPMTNTKKYISYSIDTVQTQGHKKPRTHVNNVEKTVLNSANLIFIF